MRRRTFSLGLSSAMLATPAIVRAQQSRRRVGILSGFAEASDANVIAFRQRLQELGWQPERNIDINARHATEPETLRRLAQELVALKPDAIFVQPTPALAILSKATQTIPLVFASVSAPDEGGFVKSIARPGGNVTGFTAFEYSIGGKWVELLKEALPALSRVLVLHAPDNYTSLGLKRVIEESAPKLGVKAFSYPVRSAAEIETEIFRFSGQPGAGGLIGLPHPILTNNVPLIVQLAIRHRLASIYNFRHFTQRGGLMSYGSSDIDASRKAAGYIDRILKGDRVGDLPVQNPTHFQLVINLQTAKAAGIDVPPLLLARADEVIE